METMASMMFVVTMLNCGKDEYGTGNGGKESTYHDERELEQHIE